MRKWASSSAAALDDAQFLIYERRMDDNIRSSCRSRNKVERASGRRGTGIDHSNRFSGISIDPYGDRLSRACCRRGGGEDVLVGEDIWSLSLHLLKRKGALVDRAFVDGR